jgi:hypothetical protein
MFKLLVFLCAGVFLTLLIGGRDSGQTRFGLQGAYTVAALQDAPADDRTPAADPVATPAAPLSLQPAAAPEAAPAADPQASRVTQAAFTPASEGDPALQAGLTLSLPLVDEAVATQTAAAPIAAEPAPLRISRVLGSTVNVREGPSAKTAVLDRLARDELVTVISTDGSGWSMVRIEGDGVEGYIATRYLSDPIDESALFPSE